MMPNYSNLLYTSPSFTSGTQTYTASQTCVLYFNLGQQANSAGRCTITINNNVIYTYPTEEAMGVQYFTTPFFLKAGDVFSVTISSNKNSNFKVFGCY